MLCNKNRVSLMLQTVVSVFRYLEKNWKIISTQLTWYTFFYFVYSGKGYLKDCSLCIDLELSGPIFVKLGQWASTRKDLFTEELCCCLAKLQRRTSAHSWYYTKRSLERAFGPHWKSIFVKFDNKEPVGSGCCAQVNTPLPFQFMLADLFSFHFRAPVISIFHHLLVVEGLKMAVFQFVAPCILVDFTSVSKVFAAFFIRVMSTWW